MSDELLHPMTRREYGTELRALKDEVATLTQHLAAAEAAQHVENQKWLDVHGELLRDKAAAEGERKMAQALTQAWQWRAESAEADLQRVRGALEKYGLHTYECQAMLCDWSKAEHAQHETSCPCDCGFDAALTGPATGEET